jgi:plastocyanin
MTRWLFPLFIALSTGLASAPGAVEGAAMVKGKPAADAVIWLDAPDAPKAPTRGAVLEQRDLQFFPRVLAVQVGTKVKFPNSDRVLHNVFSYHDGKPFDLGLYPVGEVKNQSFDRPGLSRVFCNIHAQMAAYVMVVDTPYFAVSDARGQFTIPDVPAGTYHYHAWRPGSPILNDVIEIKPGVPFDVRWP